MNVLDFKKDAGLWHSMLTVSRSSKGIFTIPLKLGLVLKMTESLKMA